MNPAATYPLISVLIPTYNRAAFLQEALNSALMQDYPYMEVVVSDNASEDPMDSLRERYLKDKRVRWYRNEQNIGLAPNWVKLLYEHARGDYAIILPDDDLLYDPKHLSRAAEAIRTHAPNVVFAGTMWKDEETGLQIDRSVQLPALITPEWWLQNTGRFVDGNPVFPSIPVVSTFSVPKAKQYQAFIDPVFAMDLQLGIQLAITGPSAYLDDIRVMLRRHSENDGFNASFDVVITCLKLYERILAFGRAQGIAEIQIRQFCLNFTATVVNTVVLYLWSQHKGNSIGSFLKLWRTLAEVDPRLPRKVFAKKTSLIKFFVGKNPQRQKALRQAYHKLFLKRRIVTS